MSIIMTEWLQNKGWRFSGGTCCGYEIHI
jgi:hypothetical protein